MSGSKYSNTTVAWWAVCIPSIVERAHIEYLYRLQKRWRCGHLNKGGSQSSNWGKWLSVAKNETNLRSFVSDPLSKCCDDDGGNGKYPRDLSAFEPHDATDTIECKVEHTSFSASGQDPKYEALSYTLRISPRASRGVHYRARRVHGPAAAFCCRQA
jgi:hypothetical protein